LASAETIRAPSFWSPRVTAPKSKRATFTPKRSMSRRRALGCALEDPRRVRPAKDEPAGLRAVFRAKELSVEGCGALEIGDLVDDVLGGGR
jgi:hypothetical protein